MMSALLLLVLGACREVPPPVNQDQVQDRGLPLSFDEKASYDYRVILSLDQRTYTIKAEIQAINSLTRQTDPANGGVFGAGGAVSGSFTGEVREGKGILRIKVLESDSSLAPVGSTVIIKTTDSKSVALVPGDTVTFKCRQQEELVGPVMEDQTVSRENRLAISTWELDECKMSTPMLEDK